MTRYPEAATLPAFQTKSDTFYRDMMDAMHAASQPLTILRASLGWSDEKRRSVQDLEELIARASNEVERLCTTFSCLQQLVIVESLPAEIESREVCLLVCHTLEGIDLLFAEAGVSLDDAICRQSTFEADIDASRFEQALAAALLVALNRSVKGGEVAIDIHPTEACLVMQVQANTTSTLPMTAEARLSLALSVANLRSMGGQMSWTDKPFAARISLLPATASCAH